MKLIWSVLYLGQSTLEVCAQDRTGTRRKVNLEWRAKEQEDLPPLGWEKHVSGEMDYQDSARLSPDVFSMFRKGS